MTTTAETPDVGVPAGGSIARCKRAGCGRPLPSSDQGRPRQFCSKECRIRHYNAQRGQTAEPAPAPPASGTEAALARLTQVLAEASRLATAASAQVSAADPGRIAETLAEAEAGRRRAEADTAATAAQAADSADAAEAAWEAADAADASRDAALARAEAAEAEVRDLQARVGDLASQATAATARAESAEREAGQARDARDA
ncbi:MAG: hypothetical protein ACRDOE_25130, partial [Streptosporangiaceae bacterium]